MEEKVKSGKEILDDFFNDINDIPDVDKEIAEMLSDLYQNGKLTDVNVKNELQKLREKDVDKN
jgi:flagellin-specific chaperone FliS